MDNKDFTSIDAVEFRKKFKATIEQVAKWFNVTTFEIEAYENGKSIPEVIVKRYQMFEYTGKEKPEDFEEIGDFGEVD